MRTFIRLLRLSMIAAVVFIASSAQGQTTYSNTPADSPFTTTQPPAATLGGIQTVDPNFDPYAADAPQFTQPPVLPPEGYIQPAPGGFAYQGFTGQAMRVLYQIAVEGEHLGHNGGSTKLGEDSLYISGTFQIPVFGPTLAPLLVTPGFAVHYWDGPVTPLGAVAPSLPPRTYDAYLDIGWRPWITDRLSADLGVRPGVYSDFHEVNNDSIRIQGRALVLFNYTEAWTIVGGVQYLDRFKVKILPAGGVVWTPSPDIRYELLFPQPKLATRLSTWGNTELWWYLGGQYGGGSWTYERQQDGAREGFDYNDLRVFGGIEFKPCGGLSGPNGYVEVGYAWDRELYFASRTTPDFKPDDTYMLRAGLVWER